MYDINGMLKRLSLYWWSDRHPSTYVFSKDYKTMGVGLMAGQSFAAFNLCYVLTDGGIESSLAGEEAHRTFLRLWGKAKAISELPYGDGHLSDVITMLTPAEFLTWHTTANLESYTDDQRNYLKAVCSAVSLRLQSMERILRL